MVLLVCDGPPDSLQVKLDSTPTSTETLTTKTNCVTLDLLKGGHILMSPYHTTDDCQVVSLGNSS